MRFSSICSALGSVLLTALVALGASSSSRAEVTPPDATVCPTEPTPIAPGSSPIAPGLWWNPKRSGTGWDIVRNDAGLIQVTWLTYDHNGVPIWLATNAFLADQSTETWSAPLIRYTWNGTSAVASTVGSVALRILPNDPGRLALRWRWYTYGVQEDECIIDYTRTAPAAGSSPQSANVLFSGHWYEPNPAPGYGGYGDLVRIIPRQDNLSYEESHALQLYDRNGSPVWVQSQANHGQNPPATGVWLEVPHSLKYFWSNRGIPSADWRICEDVGCTQLWGSAGTLNRMFEDSITMHAVILADFGPENMPAGAGEILWPIGTSSQPAVLTKSTSAEGIIVDRYSCTAPSGATTCQVNVNWHSRFSDVRAFQVQVSSGTGQGVSVQLSPNLASGESLVTLTAGRTYRFELRGSTPLASFTPHVRALQAIGLVAPDAAVESLDNELPAHDPTVGAIEAQAGVSGGAATYTIPIKVPPGRRGMQPSLALSYSSRSGNGIAGVGWSLSGLSSIHRCPRTEAQDDYARGVMFDAGDALCLDGQRLVKRRDSPAEYGQSAATYATEIDSFARITQMGGSLASAMAYFRVEYKSGEIHWLGAAPSGQTARSAPQGAPAPLSWLIVKREDRSGNNVYFTYADFGFGEMLLTRADYTGFDNAFGSRRVELDYQMRPGGTSGQDVSSSFLAGFESRQTQRLQEVRTFAPGNELVRKYLPAYATGNNSGRSLLSSFRECAYDATGERCLAPTTFAQNNVAATRSIERLDLASVPEFPVHSPNPPAGAFPAHVLRTNVSGDYNGDGTRELFVETSQLITAQSPASDDRAFLIALNGDRAITGSLRLLGSDLAAFRENPRLQADFDGDGRTDLLTLGSGGEIGFKFWQQTGGGFAGGAFVPATSNITALGPTSRNTTYIEHAGDFDGDGRPDLLIVRAQSNPTPLCARKVEFWLNRTPVVTSPPGSASAPPSQLAFDPEPTGSGLCLARDDDWSEHIARIADVDGNGQLDVQIDRARGLSSGDRATSEAVAIVFQHPANT